jgi:3-(methylthio)propanoyl-CoA dehydrogenase
MIPIHKDCATEASIDVASLEFLRAKMVTARFYADHLLSQVAGLQHTVQHGAPGVIALTEAQF